MFGHEPDPDGNPLSKPNLTHHLWVVGVMGAIMACLTPFVGRNTPQDQATNEKDKVRAETTPIIIAEPDTAAAVPESDKNKDNTITR